MVKMIATVHGKKLILVKGFGWALKLMGFFVGMVHKAFGNLCYEMEMSEYKADYRIKNLKDSIEETENLR